MIKIIITLIVESFIEKPKECYTTPSKGQSHGGAKLKVNAGKMGAHFCRLNTFCKQQFAEKEAQRREFNAVKEAKFKRF